MLKIGSVQFKYSREMWGHKYEDIYIRKYKIP